MGIVQSLIERPTSNPAGGLTPNSNLILPTVSDPGQTYANITRSEYEDYVNGFRNYELGLINRAQTDTSLIDQAKTDAPKASKLAQDVAERNRTRYGMSFDPATERERERSFGRLGALGFDNAVNNARIDQDTLNTSLLSGLIDIGQGVNSTAQSQLGSSAANASQLDQAYRSARSASRANTFSTIGQLGALALMAF